MPPYREGEKNHGDGGHGGAKDSELEYALEKASRCSPAAKEGENEGPHAEIGDGTEDGVVCLEDTEKTVVGCSQVSCDKVLYKEGNSLNQEVYAGDKYANLDVL